MEVIQIFTLIFSKIQEFEVLLLEMINEYLLLFHQILQLCSMNLILVQKYLIKKFYLYFYHSDSFYLQIQIIYLLLFQMFIFSSSIPLFIDGFVFFQFYFVSKVAKFNLYFLFSNFKLYYLLKICCLFLLIKSLRYFLHYIILNE